MAAGYVLIDELVDAVFAEVAGFGNAGNLEEGGIGGDVGIETRGGGGDQVDRDGLAGILGGQLIDVALDPRYESLVGLGQVRATGGGGVIAVARRRGPGMEVLVGGEALGDQLGADDRAILELDEASRSFVRKDHSGDASDEQWITQA